MNKVYINSIGKNVDICLKQCGGIYFDNREFEKVDEQHENINEILDIIKDKSFQKVDDTELRVCPYCVRGSH